MTGKEFLHERKSLGWTQGEVAKVMGCAVRSVRRWEKGEVRVPQSLETIIALRREVERWHVRAEHYSDQWSAVGTKGQAIIDELSAEIERLRQPKTVTFTVVSAADGNPMHTFKIDPTKKTILRPLHSMIGYVFEPEEQSE